MSRFAAAAIRSSTSSTSSRRTGPSISCSATWEWATAIPPWPCTARTSPRISTSSRCNSACWTTSTTRARYRATGTCGPPRGSPATTPRRPGNRPIAAASAIMISKAWSQAPIPWSKRSPMWTSPRAAISGETWRATASRCTTSANSSRPNSAMTPAKRRRIRRPPRARRNPPVRVARAARCVPASPCPRTMAAGRAPGRGPFLSS